MSKLYPFEPDWQVTPGEVIQDFLERYGMTQTDFAERLGLSQKHVNEIINGKAPITLQTSVLISRVLGGEYDYWLRLQQLCDREKIRLSENNQQYKYFLEAEPIRELIRRGCIDYVSGRDTVDKGVDSALRFFKASTVHVLRSQFPENTRLRQSAKVKSDPLALLCWLRCCELECEKIECQDYDESKFRETLQNIRSMTPHPPENFFGLIQKMCAECGVAVAAVPEFKNAAVNGAAQWRGKKAFIMMNLRGKFADIFWFSFFHEAGHILKGSKKFQYIEGDWKSRKEYDQQQLDREEKKADDFARDFLIPPRFRAELPHLKTCSQIVAFAEKVGVHPGVVVGRLHNDEYVDHDRFNKLRVRFRWGKKECS